MTQILFFIRAGGFIMYPLLLLSLAAGVVIVERLIAFRQMGHLAPGLLDRVIRLCHDGHYDEALQACRTQNGPLAACLKVVLQHRHQPIGKIERWIEETGQEYFIRLERFLPVLDTTTTISPLLGLLGTIIGMIGAFNAITVQQTRGNNDAVLHGVAEALYATAAGITVAVICFIAYNYFAARLRTIIAETEMAATKLLNVLSENHFDESSGDEPSARHRIKFEQAAHLDAAAGTKAAGEQEDSRAVQTATRA